MPPELQALMSAGGPPGGGMAGGGGMPGGNEVADMGVAALAGLSPKQANPTVALAKVEEALDLAYKLVNTVTTQISQWNPKAAKELHAVARQIISAKMDLRKEGQPGLPPAMMGEMGGGIPAFGTPTGTPFGTPSGQF